MKKIVFNLLCISVSFFLNAQEWDNVNSGTNLRLNSISFGSSSVGYIGANDSTLLKSIDAGDSWFVQNTNGIDFTDLPHITQVDFLTDSIGFLTVGTADYAGQIYKTLDGGVNWTLENTLMCSPVRIFNFDEDNAYAIGSGCFSGKNIQKKENGTWAGVTHLSWQNDYLRAIDFYNEDYGIVAGDSGTFYRTFNAGQNWDTVENYIDSAILDLKFQNDSTVFTVIEGQQNSLFYSVDSGATWQEHSNSLTFFYPRFEALTVSESNEVIAVGSTGLNLNGGTNPVGFILWGTDDDSFWLYESVDQPLHAVTSLNDSTAFAVGDSGLIVVRNLVPDLNVIEENPITVEIYPNPVQDVLHIVSDHEHIFRLRIYDMLGKLVQVSNMESGEINISHLTPGIYNLSLETDEGDIRLKILKL